MEGIKAAFFCFKQLHLKDKHEFESGCQEIDGERLLLAVTGVAGFSV